MPVHPSATRRLLVVAPLVVAGSAAAPPTAARPPGLSGSQRAVPPAYPAQKPANGNAAAAGKSQPGVFGGFKRRIFGGRQDDK